MQYRAYFETGNVNTINAHNIEGETADQLLDNVISTLTGLGLASQVLENLIIYTPDREGSVALNLHPDRSLTDPLSGERVDL